MELSLKSCQGCLVRRPRPPAHETTSASSPVRRPRPPAHETTLASYPVSKPRPPAHETTLDSYPVRKPRPPAHETTLDSSLVRRPRPPAHETTLDSSRAQTAPSCSRDNLGQLSREQLGLSLLTGEHGWSAFFGTRPHIGREYGHRTAESFLLKH